MVAIGFVGLLLFGAWAWLRQNAETSDIEEWALIALFVTADCLLTVGIAIWLWRVMP